MKDDKQLDSLLNKIKSAHKPEEAVVAVYSNEKTDEFKRYFSGNALTVTTASTTIIMETVKKFANNQVTGEYMIARTVEFLIAYAYKNYPGLALLKSLYSVLEKECPEDLDHIGLED